MKSRMASGEDFLTSPDLWTLKHAVNSSLTIGLDSIKLAPIHPNTSYFTTGFAFPRTVPKTLLTNMSLTEVFFVNVFSVK